MKDTRKLRMHHLMEEWKSVNEKIAHIQNSLLQLWGGLTSVFIGAVVIIAVKDNLTEHLGPLVAIIPLFVICFFGYLSYLFRLINVLRGYSAKLEKELNNLLGENIHQWYSTYWDTYITKNNLINSTLKFPFIFSAWFVYIFCLVVLYQELPRIFVQPTVQNGIFALYIMGTGVLCLLTLIPFFFNKKKRLEISGESE